MHQHVWLLPCYVVKNRYANSILQINTIAMIIEVGLDKGYNMITLEKFVK
jgi:hypothetical protein